jgi:hypothetical protein
MAFIAFFGFFAQSSSEGGEGAYILNLRIF